MDAHLILATILLSFRRVPLLNLDRTFAIPTFFFVFLASLAAFIAFSWSESLSADYENVKMIEEKFL